jgi:hypothetical protein
MKTANLFVVSTHPAWDKRVTIALLYVFSSGDPWMTGFENAKQFFTIYFHGSVT